MNWVAVGTVGILPRRRIVLACLLLTGAALARPAMAAELLIAVGQSELFVVDVSRSADDAVTKLWTWSGQTAEGIADEHRRWFGNLDDCKPIDGGRKLLVTASNGGCALIERPGGRVLWYAHATNAHSIELLPRHRVAVASSLGGNEVILFDLSRSWEPLFKTPLHSAHGLVWDDERQRLWTLGFGDLRSYTLTDWESDHPQLTLRDTIPLPDEDGHDLRPVTGSHDLVLSTHHSCWLFDRTNQQFRPYEALKGSEKVKSIDVHPRTGRVAVGRWTSEVSLLNPDRQLTFAVNRPYKVRWLVSAAEIAVP